MLSRTVFVCLFMVLSSSCVPQQQELHIVTPQPTPVAATATSATALPPALPSPLATSTPQPTPILADVIRPDNLEQVKLLHEYWLAVATAAGVDPYEMDISTVASSPDGRLLAVGGCSKELEEDLRSGNVFCDGVDSQNLDGAPFLLILDVNTENVIGIVPENEAGTLIADLAFTSDGKKLIYAIHPGKFVLWDVELGQVESVLWEGETSAPRISISPDGKWIALTTADQAIIFDPAIGEFVAEIPVYLRAQFSADSSRVLVYYDTEFIVYETGTWIELMRFGIPCDCIYAFSPDFLLLATSERAPMERAPVLIWDVSTGDQIQSLQGGREFVAFLSFTPDGRMLWRAGNLGDLAAWDTSNWQILAENIGGLIPIFDLDGFQFVGNGRNYLLFSQRHIGLYGLP